MVLNLQQIVVSHETAPDKTNLPQAVPYHMHPVYPPDTFRPHTSRSCAITVVRANLTLRGSTEQHARQPSNIFADTSVYF